ncbi:MAG: glutamate synthase [Acetobacterium sp.]
MIIQGKDVAFTDLNKAIKAADASEVTVENIIGQRYIGSGVEGKNLILYGTPGNALGAYLNNCNITVHGNVQDAVGDTMNNGEIIVHGNGGDTLGYAMRGGAIYVRGNGGYRVGIHMKEYQELKPVIVVGGKVGSFLGEYQAGGIIVILGLGVDNSFPTGNYCGTGMHGGVMYIRSDVPPENLPPHLIVKKCIIEDLNQIRHFIANYCEFFDVKETDIFKKSFYKLTPGANHYNTIYAHN